MPAKKRAASLKKRLSMIQTPNDFEKILNAEAVRFVGSRRRLAETLRNMASSEKKDIIDQAIKYLSMARNWNYAGD